MSYKDKEKMREYMRQYNKERRQEHNEYVLKWKAEHPEHVKRQQQRQIQRAHDRYHNDPAYRGYRLFINYKRLDIKKNVMPADPSDYPSQEEVSEMLLQPCVFCGERDWHKIGLDRKDNRFGHIRGNIQPCCKRCNDKKRELSNEEFRQAIDDGRIKLKTVKAVKADPAIPAMPSMRSLLV